MTFYFLDVFGQSRYSGNQLAVFRDAGNLSPDEMQKIAREINFSETTFITAAAGNDGGFPVRIFTPGSEVDFAGHPTLGTAYIIHKYLQNSREDIVTLHLKAGQIPVTFHDDLLWMKQNQPQFGKKIEKEPIAELLGLRTDEILAGYPIEEVSTGLPFIIVPLKSLESLKRARVNFNKYPDFIQDSWAKGIMIFCPEGHESRQDLSTRVFVDYYGIPEDPATGSATGCLAAWLIKYGVFGKSGVEMTIGQGYEIGRPSELLINASMKEDQYEIYVGGKVFEVATGEWT